MTQHWIFLLSVVHKAILSRGFHTAPTPLVKEWVTRKTIAMFLTIKSGYKKFNMYEAQKAADVVARVSLQLQNKERQDVGFSKCWLMYKIQFMGHVQNTGQNIENVLFLSLL